MHKLETSIAALINLTNDAFQMLNKSVETIRKYSSEVVAGSIDRFYRYKYNFICMYFIPEYNMRTGGNSMFDFGNKVSSLFLTALF